MKKRLQAWGYTTVIPIASVIVLNCQGQILLLQRHSQDLGGKRWGTPGGRLDDGERADEAALRELREETGIIAPNVDLLGEHIVQMPHGTVHMTTFKTVIPGNVIVTIDPEEHHAYKWFNIAGVLYEPELLWGVPTVLRDFGFIEALEADPTLRDGTRITFV